MTDQEFWASTPRKLMFKAHMYKQNDPTKPKVLKGDEAIKDLMRTFKK